ncbi:MAG: methyltransferase domain-containing protein [Thermoanaerobaculia bacterium]
MEDLISILACPRDRGALRREGSHLVCAAGHEYPVVEGVPVLLVEEDEPTIGIASASIGCARRSAAGKSPSDPWFTATLGISEAERSELLEQAAGGDMAIDPAARFLVAATNGILYRDLVGTLTQYPIPELRLPAGGGRRLLDIGCSWGRWSIAAARKGYRPVGIDPSLGAVLAAQRITQGLGLEAQFVVGDARRLPFTTGPFAAVFSYSVLQHFDPAVAATSLREVGRVLAPGGLSLIQMANGYGLRSLYHQARRGFRSPKDFEVRYWAPRELLEVFQQEIGRSQLSVDGFFGLGLQASDRSLMSAGRRRILAVSEAFRAASARFPWMLSAADSLYVESMRRAAGSVEG